MSAYPRAIGRFLLDSTNNKMRITAGDPGVTSKSISFAVGWYALRDDNSVDTDALDFIKALEDLLAANFSDLDTLTGEFHVLGVTDSVASIRAGRIKYDLGTANVDLIFVGTHADFTFDERILGIAVGADTTFAFGVGTNYSDFTHRFGFYPEREDELDLAWPVTTGVHMQTTGKRRQGHDVNIAERRDFRVTAVHPALSRVQALDATGAAELETTAGDPNISEEVFVQDLNNRETNRWMLWYADREVTTSPAGPYLWTLESGKHQDPRSGNSMHEAGEQTTINWRLEEVT